MREITLIEISYCTRHSQHFAAQSYEQRRTPSHKANAHKTYATLLLHRRASAVEECDAREVDLEYVAGNKKISVQLLL